MVFRADDVNVNGDVSDTLALPAGIGDVAIMECLVQGSSIATAVANLELSGAGITVQTAGGGNTVDIVGTEARWSLTSAAAAVLYVSPDPLVLWRQNELLSFTWRELDTNASPTVDYLFLVKCVRVRPIEAPARGPIRLVR